MSRDIGGAIQGLPVGIWDTTHAAIAKQDISVAGVHHIAGALVGTGAATVDVASGRIQILELTGDWRHGLGKHAFEICGPGW